MGRGDLSKGLGDSAQPDSAVLRQSLIAASEKTTRLIQAGEYRPAIAHLQEVVESCDASVEPKQGAGRQLALVYGKLGECYFHSGCVEHAKKPAQIALRLSKDMAHRKGIGIHLRNLFEIYRYLGQREFAAKAAAGLARVLNGLGAEEEARWLYRQAEIVRGGEPLNRVIARVSGLPFEVDDLPRIHHGRVGLEFYRNRTPLRGAVVLTEKGKNLSRRGKHSEALSIFKNAIALDPFDPDPWYQSGLAWLLLARPRRAEAALEKAEKLAPGWFRCRDLLWFSRKLAMGEASQTEFASIHELDDDFPRKDELKARLARALSGSKARLPQPHLFLGRYLLRQAKPREAVEVLQAGLRLAGSNDVKTRILFALACCIRPGSKKTGLLEKAVALNGSLTAAASAKIALRLYA